MKKEKNIETKAKSQKPDSIKDALSSQIQSRNRVQFNYAIPQSPLRCVVAEPVEARGRGEVLGLILGKAPPGQARSPGAARGHPPAKKVDKPENKAGPPDNQNILQIGEEIFINKKQNSNFYKHLNFIIMKKQILILIVALFAVTSAFGQINPDPKVSLAPTCGGTATNPSVGVSYPYTVAVTTTPGYTGVGTYTWKVTDKTDLLAASTVAGTVFTGTVGAAGTYNIVWNASAVGNTYYVVVDYSEPNTSGGSCTINNVKVFEVQPMNGFWLKINASTDGSVGNIIANNGVAKISVCSPAVSKADITTTGDPATARVTYEFGVTKLYASIHAGGYTGDFQAILTVAGLTANQKAAIPTGWAAGTVDALGNGTYTQTLTIPTGASQDYPVELDITNNQFEGKADLPVTITIDGTYAAGTQKDKYDQTLPTAVTCQDQPDADDYVIQTIEARPTVVPTNPAGFVTPNPALN